MKQGIESREAKCVEDLFFVPAEYFLGTMAWYDSLKPRYGPPQVLVPTEEVAGKHYQEHVERPFYPGLVKFLASGPVVAMVWQGKDVIKCDPPTGFDRVALSNSALAVTE